MYVCMHTHTHTHTQVLQTLEDLQTEYLDVYLVHWPVPGKHVEAYKELEVLQGYACMHACMHAHIHEYIHVYLFYQYMHIYIYIIYSCCRRRARSAPSG